MSKSAYPRADPIPRNREQMIEPAHAGRKLSELVREFGCTVTSTLDWVRQADAVSDVMPT